MIIIYTTFANNEEAEKLSRQLVEEKLAACVNIFPIQSFYRWQDKVEYGAEIVGLIKTRKENFEQVKDFIQKHHSYDTPCVIELPVSAASEKYVEWVQKNTDN